MLADQKNSRRLWRSPKRKSRSVPESRTNFLETFSFPKNSESSEEHGVAFFVEGRVVTDRGNGRSEISEVYREFWKEISYSRWSRKCLILRGAEKFSEPFPLYPLPLCLSANFTIPKNSGRIFRHRRSLPEKSS